MSNFEWVIENEQAFKRGIDRLGQVTSDFRIPFRIIASDFYRSQKKIFQLKTEGLYAPLGGKNPYAPSGFGSQTRRERAETLKERRTKHSWAPILYGMTGDLRDSTLGRDHKYSIFFLGRQELEIGTSVPYGPFLQNPKDSSPMPERRFIFIDGGPNDASNDSKITGRRERWLDIMNDHVLQIISGEIL